MDNGISVSFMKEFADNIDIPMSSDIGNVITLDNDNDDMGMNLLANSNYSSSKSERSNTISISNSGPGIGDIDIAPLESIDAISMDLPGINDNSNRGSSNIDIGISRDNGYSSNDYFGNSQSASGPSISLTTQVDPEKERAQKADYINKLSRLEAKGFQVSKRFTMDNTLDEIKTEHDRLVDARQLETSIKFQRQMMMGLVTGLEMMNEKFNPLDWKLGGWSESVHENIDDFDEIFEELYDKYKERGKMPPEARLLMSLVGSGFMFHMSNSFFRSKMPSMDDILKQNPDMARQFAAAAANAAGPGFGNFMGMAMGVPAQGGVQPQQPMGGAPMNTGFFPQAQPARQAAAPMPPAMMPQHIAAQEEKQTARREMKGPVGVDDILKTFDEVRRAETDSMFNSNPMMPQSMPSVFNQPAVIAASEINSIHSDDMRSQADSTRTGGTRGGQRRRRAAPVGNVIALNV